MAAALWARRCRKLWLRQPPPTTSPLPCCWCCCLILVQLNYPKPSFRHLICPEPCTSVIVQICHTLKAVSKLHVIKSACVFSPTVMRSSAFSCYLANNLFGRQIHNNRFMYSFKRPLAIVWVRRAKIAIVSCEPHLCENKPIRFRFRAPPMQ